MFLLYGIIILLIIEIMNLILFCFIISHVLSFNLSGRRFYLPLNVIYQSIGMRTLLAGIFHISVVCGLHGFYFLVIVVVNILPVILRI